MMVVIQIINIFIQIHIMKQYNLTKLKRILLNIIKTKEEIENNQQPKPRTKTQMDETILNQEEFNLKEYIKTENTKKYILLEDAKYVFNINIRRSDDGKTLTFETIKYLEKSVAGYLNKEGLSLTDNYQNRRSIVDRIFNCFKC